MYMPTGLNSVVQAIEEVVVVTVVAVVVTLKCKDAALGNKQRMKKK